MVKKTDLGKILPNRPSSVLFIPHGGGPLPLLGDKGHKKMVDFLKGIASKIGKPSAIIVISAHWEEEIVTITSGKSPSLIYDYYGFPEESYKIKYPAPGNPSLAKKIFSLLQNHKIPAVLDDKRGFDHGLFVPLKIMYPDTSIPCVQISLLNSLDAQAHIEIGRALTDLRKEDVLILGSGFSFHNLSEFFSSAGKEDIKNEMFQDWLIEACTEKISPEERMTKLVQWEKAKFARYCHPREEHLLPLHVCAGIAGNRAELVFYDEVTGKKACAFLWKQQR